MGKLACPKPINPAGLNGEKAASNVSTAAAGADGSVRRSKIPVRSSLAIRRR